MKTIMGCIAVFASAIEITDVVAAGNSSPATLTPSANIQKQNEKRLQPVRRDDRKFEEIWSALHNCESFPTAKDGYISSEYLRRRGYSASDPEGKGYASIPVDERLYGMRVQRFFFQLLRGQSSQ